MDSVAVLVLFFNKVDQTIDCIKSFIPSRKKIYILNNGSDEIQWDKLTRAFNRYPQVILLDAKENLGPAAGRNMLIKHSSEEWLFFVDNDITIKQVTEWASIFNQLVSKFPEASIICPRIYNVHESAYMERLNLLKSANSFSILYGDFTRSNVFPEGGALVRRNVFQRFGLYDEMMFAFEGFEFSIRCMTSFGEELEVYNISEIELIHNHKYQSSENDKKAIRQRYDNQKLNSSFERLVSKFGIDFDHEWQGWAQNQTALLTEPSILRSLKQKFRRLLSK